MSNSAQILGSIADAPVFSHSIYGENFYTFELYSMRLSGRIDRIPCLAAERNLQKIDFSTEQLYCGQLRSYNKLVDGVNRLDLRLFVRDILPDGAEPTQNAVSLEGYVCKAPAYRRTPFGREITDMLIAVNRAYHKSDYLPVIAWGKNARAARDFAVGDRLRLLGRLQSREYEKILEDGTQIRRTAYEVSVSILERLKAEQTEPGSRE